MKETNYTFALRLIVAGVVLSLIAGYFYPNEKTVDLFGRWQAHSFVENQDTLEMDLTNVIWEFLPNGKYKLHGTLNEKMQGRYFYKPGKIIFEREESVSKPLFEIKVLNFDSDTLAVQWIDSNETKDVTFIRMKEK
jgi:hypothetical protein